MKDQKQNLKPLFSKPDLKVILENINQISIATIISAILTISLRLSISYRNAVDSAIWIMFRCDWGICGANLINAIRIYRHSKQLGVTIVTRSLRNVICGNVIYWEVIYWNVIYWDTILLLSNASTFYLCVRVGTRILVSMAYFVVKSFIVVGRIIERLQEDRPVVVLNVNGCFAIWASAYALQHLELNKIFVI